MSSIPRGWTALPTTPTFRLCVSTLQACPVYMGCFWLVSEASRKGARAPACTEPRVPPPAWPGSGAADHRGRLGRKQSVETPRFTMVWVQDPVALGQGAQW